MIVTCQQCDTQFRLDDSKVGAAGLRVRCSLCKHAFLVEAPQAAPPPPAEPAPGDSQEITQPGADPAPFPREGPGDESWEFDDARISLAGDPDEEIEVPAPQPPASREVVQQAVNDLLGPEPEAAPTVAAPAGSDEDLLASLAAELTADAEQQEPFSEADDDELGTPENWDFFAGDNLSQGLRGPAPELSTQPVTAPTEVPCAPRVAAERSASPWSRRSVSRLPAFLSRTASGLGWVALVGLVAAGLVNGVRWQGPLPRVDAPPVVRAVAGLELQVERARFVENVGSRRLFVVSGTLRNPGVRAATGTLLGVRLTGPDGGLLDGFAPLGPPLSQEELREWSPDQLARVQRDGAMRLAAVPLRPGERWLFDAVALQAPPETAGFVFESRPLGAASAGS